MNIAEQVYQQMQTLPTNMQIEALHYIEFLQQKIKTISKDQPKIKVITAKQAKLPDINEPSETHNQRFIKHLLNIPKSEDNEDLFVRVNGTMRDIDLVD